MKGRQGCLMEEPPFVGWTHACSAGNRQQRAQQGSSSKPRCPFFENWSRLSHTSCGTRWCRRRVQPAVASASWPYQAHTHRSAGRRAQSVLRTPAGARLRGWGGERAPVGHQATQRRGQPALEDAARARFLASRVLRSGLQRIAQALRVPDFIPATPAAPTPAPTPTHPPHQHLHHYNPHSHILPTPCALEPTLGTAGWSVLYIRLFETWQRVRPSRLDLPPCAVRQVEGPHIVCWVRVAVVQTGVPACLAGQNSRGQGACSKRRKQGI